VLAGADHGQLALAVDLAPRRGHRDGAAPGQVRAGQRPLVGQQVLVGAAVHDVAAVLAGAGPDVDDPVRGPDGVLVVLDHDERVA
jgi:hypothetical protein